VFQEAGNGKAVRESDAQGDARAGWNTWYVGFGTRGMFGDVEDEEDVDSVARRSAAQNAGQQPSHENAVMWMYIHP
jgi:hypothetical protein